MRRSADTAPAGCAIPTDGNCADWADVAGMPPGYSLPESYAERTACTFDRRAYGPNQYFAEATGKREPWQTHHAPSGGTSPGR